MSRILAADLLASGLEEAEDLQDLAEEARDYLLYHTWCRSIKQLWFDRGFSKFALFFAEIEPDERADHQIWVIVGDVPPLFIGVGEAVTALDAIEIYGGVLDWWIEEVEKGTQLDDLPPLRIRNSLKLIEPTGENVELVKSRLRLIDEIVLPNFFDPAEPC